jgi:NAD-dependent SIR2 family protein deacetylase
VTRSWASALQRNAWGAGALSIWFKLHKKRIIILHGEEMSKTVFILGAGASAEAGVPVMSNFIQKAEDLFEKKLIKNLKAYNAIFGEQSEMYRLHSKAQIEITNIENVLAIIDMGKLFNKFFKLSGEEITNLASYYKIFLGEVIENTTIFRDYKEKIFPNLAYEKFGSLIYNITHVSKDNKSVSVFTFNYDYCVDNVLESFPVNYKLNSQETNDGISLLKLHGSLNWRRCKSPNCNKVSIIKNPVAQYSGHDRDTKFLHFYFSEVKKITCDYCGNSEMSLEPEIIPPTWNKTGQFADIAEIWKSAAKELEDARNIVIIGYSLPESDMFFKYLFALGVFGSVGIRKFWVVNPDPEVEERFKKLIGPAISKSFHFFKSTFGEIFSDPKFNYSKFLE